MLYEIFRGWFDTFFFFSDLKKQKEKHEPDEEITPSASFFRYLSSLYANPRDKLHPNDNYSRLKLLLRPGDMAKSNFPLPLPGYRENRNAEFVLTCDKYKEVCAAMHAFTFSALYYVVSIDVQYSILFIYLLLSFSQCILPL